MGRVYIVYYDFPNTSGNHAGMAHLVKLLCSDLSFAHSIKNLPQDYKCGKYLGKAYSVLIAFYFRLVLKRDDKVFFFEYLTKGVAYNSTTAKTMRRLGLQNTIYGLVHLSGGHLMGLYENTKCIMEDLKPVDKVIVFGSSLASFLKQINFPKKIKTTFHYVDTNYYNSHKVNDGNGVLQVVFIGNLKRNFDVLHNVVKRLPDIKFHILMGANNLRPLFEIYTNVECYPFISEHKMLSILQNCDVNISVMEDTVGSNAITCSMAVGLPQVVSDVGSIRDYCDEYNSIFCKDENDFVIALSLLNRDRKLLKSMKTSALERSKNFSYEMFLKEFVNLL